jgi:phage terminase small subunit
MAVFWGALFYLVVVVKVNERQKRFSEEYIIDLDATAAAIRAGYSEKNASSIGYQLLQKTPVKAYIAELIKKRSERTKVDADYVLQRLVAIDQMDVIDILNDDGTIKPLTMWPKIWREFLTSFELSEIIEGQGDDKKIVGILKKIKWPDKLKNLELIGRHVAVQAWKDTVKVDGVLHVTLSPEEAALR